MKFLLFCCAVGLYSVDALRVKDALNEHKFLWWGDSESSSSKQNRGVQQPATKISSHTKQDHLALTATGCAWKGKPSTTVTSHAPAWFTQQYNLPRHQAKTENAGIPHVSVKPVALSAEEVIERQNNHKKQPPKHEKSEQHPQYSVKPTALTNQQVLKLLENQKKQNLKHEKTQQKASVVSVKPVALSNQEILRLEHQKKPNHAKQNEPIPYSVKPTALSNEQILKWEHQQKLQSQAGKQKHEFDSSTSSSSNRQ